MAITEALTVRQQKTDLVVDLLDLGTAGANGTIGYLNSSNTTLATGNLANPAAGDADGSAISTFNAIGNAQVTTAGTISKFRLYDRDGTQLIEGTVTGISGGGDIEITDTDVSVNELIQTDSLTYQSP